MRSSFFVLLSLLVHALCVAAVAISPTQISAPEGTDIEVQIGEPAEQPGLETAPEGVSEAAEPLSEVKEPVKVTAAATKKTKVVKAPMEKVAEDKPAKKTTVVETGRVENKITELPPKEETLDPEIEEIIPVAPVATEDASQPQLIPVKETAPAGVEASDEETEATAEEAKGADPSPVGKGTEPTEDGELAKGGATQAGAVSYLDLKQAQGNRSPLYPLQARKEARQGQVELLYRVTKEGRVADLQVAKSSGHKDLDQEAARAVAQFRFVPGQEGWARHPVSFNLKGQAAELPSRLRSAQTE